ncbi:hypothetical protein AX14_013881 [Amanita brunnescens Koide BX004]|nr:hypothetical protein AX14_013881 [Amanita brunnescens Koide BX004]
MYETLTQFHGSEIHLSSLFHGIGIFLLSFSGSMAMGVVFGLAMSLLMKHSSLNLYSSIESCLVALCAYTCYFFSTGLGLSGIVSLLFCGITLKHYAYHTMSRRTQRASRYIFSTLAQLSENFIFIYLGISLFTSAPVSEPVLSYVKPLFITITTVAVVFTRYAAVFPLSEVINFFHKHARGQRTEELPHSYQMMLFWAGLRGAVGVALAAGFKGSNAKVLRMTVLVVVVLTVVLFGGTTARMLEVLGIRTGVEEEVGSDSDDEDALNRNVWLGRRSARWNRYGDDEFSSPISPSNPFSRIGSHYAHLSYNHQAQASQRQLNSDQRNQAYTESSESFESELGEVLPMAPTSHEGTSSAQRPDPRRSPNPVEDGKWFQTLDERYLLPLFSNATASRTFHARRARRNAPNGSNMSGGASPADSDFETDPGQEVELGHTSTTLSLAAESRNERGLHSPVLRNSNGSGDNHGL